MKKGGKYLIQGITFLLILMWFYAATSKLLSFQEFKISMSNQPLPHFLQSILIYTLPATEIAVAVLILFRRTLQLGLILSLFLMLAFTVYISLGLINALKWVPCSCGGILQQMTWPTHLVFNLAYITIILIAIYHSKKERNLSNHKDHKISVV